MRVLLPTPVGPTMAVRLPGLKSYEKSFSTGVAESGYAKVMSCMDIPATPSRRTGSPSSSHGNVGLQKREVSEGLFFTRKIYEIKISIAFGKVLESITLMNWFLDKVYFGSVIVSGKAITKHDIIGTEI